MSDNARLVSSSRSAPRDPNVRSGRQPVSIFNDTRAYRLWDGQEEEEDKSMSRAHSGTLASKETDYRINVMHRTFRASQRGPRASARAQVDEIVSETEGGDDDRKFYESLEKDLDPEQLARLRERNKKRLDALERQLTKLKERKEVVMQGGTDPEDEDSDAGMAERTRAYQPDPYKDDTSASDSSPVKRPAASRKPAAPKSAWGDKYGAASHGRDSATERGDAPADPEPSERPRLHARVPKALSRPSSAKPPAAPASAAGGADDDGKGYLSDPGAAGAKRPVSATLSASGRGIGYKSAKEARKSCTVPEPFSFDNRERFKKKPIVQLRLEQEMLERLEIEQIEYSQTFKARPPPQSTTEKLYEKNLQDQKEKSERIRRESKERLSESQQPFEFWLKAKEDEKQRHREQMAEIDRVKKELSLYGVSEQRIKKIEKGAWEEVKTDFTLVEQEELRILEMLVQSKRKLTPKQEDRKKALEAERKKKLQSAAYTDELERRVKEELEKQEKRFRSVPVPKHVKEDVWGMLELQAGERASKNQERALRLLNTADLPPRMKRHQAEHPDEWAPKHRKYPGNDGDTVTEHHTFKPKVKGTVPDFKQLHKVFDLQLKTKKQEIQREAKRTDIKPFYLRTEWVSAEELKIYRKQYAAAKISTRLPPGKLKKLGLDAKASQWDVISKITSKNSVGMDRAGLTQAEMIEYKITPPSYHSINEAINKDIAKLRDHRWPHTKGGRKPVMPTPVPDSMKTRPAKEPSLTVAARSRQLAIQKEKREKEQARRKAEEAVLAMKKARKETWNMKDKVLQKLAKDAEDRRTTAEKAKEELEERIRDFRNMDKMHQARVAASVEEVKSRGLLMETIKRKLKKQANDQFRKHLKARGLEDLADQIENPA